MSAAAHEASIALSAVAPPWDDPYPTLVGTPITGARARPPTRLVSAVHAGHDDHAVRALEIGERGREAMDTGDADVLVDDHGRAEQLRADARLPHDGPVGRAGGNYNHQTPGLGHSARDPDAAGERVLLRLRRDLAHRGTHVAVRPRHEHAPGAALDERLHDARDLLGSLSLREDRLRRALAQLAVEVDAREAEVAERERAQPLERLVRCRRSRPDLVEERAQIIAEPGHSAIVR